LHEDSLAEEVKLGTYIYNNLFFFFLFKIFFLTGEFQINRNKVWEDAIDSETATPAAYIGSKALEEEEQEEVEEVQGEEEDYDVELEEDTTVLGEEILDDQFSTPDDDLQKEFENALERFDEMSDSSDKDEEEETTESEESTSESDESEDEDRMSLIKIINEYLFIYFPDC
jgi:hypothetical protein